MDDQLFGLERGEKSGNYDHMKLVVSKKMDGYEPMNALSENVDDQKDHECEKSMVNEKEQSDYYHIVEKIAINE